MPSKAPTFGVPVMYFGLVDEPTAIGSLAATTIAYSVITPSKYRKSSVKKKLSGTYNITLALLGYDIVNKGFTIGISSPASANQVVTSGQGVLCRITSANFATNMANAIAVAVFVKKGNGNPRMANFSYIDPDTDWSFLVTHEPLAAAVSETQTVLGAATPTDQTGSRVAKGVLYTKKGPTTGGVRFIHRQEQVNVSPDDSTDYTAPTARATDVEFSLMSNAIVDLADIMNGDSVTYTDTNGDTVEQGDNMDIQSIISQLTGNFAIKALQPPDKRGNQVTRLLMGNLITSSSEFTEDYQKSQQFRLDMRLNAASIDELTGAVGTGVLHSRYV